MDEPRQRDFLGVGWSFPVTSDAASGDVELSWYEQDVKEAIRIILQTSRGERVMRPRFGCGIHDLVFEEINATTIATVDAAVRESLITYEPRIELLNVAVDPFDALNGLLLVKIDYRIRRTNQTDNLIYPFYFREGGIA
jgi:phage baseplate assembly protein W